MLLCIFMIFLVSILIFANLLGWRYELELIVWGLFAWQHQELEEQWENRLEAECPAVTHLFSLIASGLKKVGMRAHVQDSF